MQTIELAIAGSAFVTFGALFSPLLSDGVETAGPKLLLQGLGFSTSYFIIVLSRAALFTEANVILPASALQTPEFNLPPEAWRFWALAWVGNMVGAFLFGQIVGFAQVYPESVTTLMSATVDKKMAYMIEGGTAVDWLRVVVSGALGNGLIGMAAFFAIMANTLIGKYVPIFLVVSLFVAGNLQHSPANMGYFSLAAAMADMPGWGTVFLWNIIPAGIGNILGAVAFVAFPFWFAYRND